MTFISLKDINSSQHSKAIDGRMQSLDPNDEVVKKEIIFEWLYYKRQNGCIVKVK